MTTNSVTLDARGVHFSEKKEEAYFTATFTLPRVGEVSTRYIADRYVAPFFGNSDKGREDWTDWRIIRQGEIAGVGPKTAGAVREMVEPAIKEWLEGEGYKSARQKAVAKYIIRALQEAYGFSSGKRAFEKYRSELSYYDHTRIAQAIDHLEAAEALLEDKVPA